MGGAPLRGCGQLVRVPIGGHSDRRKRISKIVFAVEGRRLSMERIGDGLRGHREARGRTVGE